MVKFQTFSQLSLKQVFNQYIFVSLFLCCFFVLVYERFDSYIMNIRRKSTTGYPNLVEMTLKSRKKRDTFQFVFLWKMWGWLKFPKKAFYVFDLLASVDIGSIEISSLFFTSMLLTCQAYELINFQGFRLPQRTSFIKEVL